MDLIETIDSVEARQRRQQSSRRQNRRRHSSIEEENVSEVPIAEFVQSLNELDTLASTILKDPTPHKRNVLSILAKQSAVAKRLLDVIENGNDKIKLNGSMQAIETLRLFSDIFDNKFVGNAA
ncbi:unknown [Helicoverpa armigera nucleopolyhedrovirus]|uniref:13.1K n=4 Tax=Alphabaculovirus helarmigerae TaxID=3047947 RepID=Q99GV9_9ABAC